MTSKEKNTQSFFRLFLAIGMAICFFPFVLYRIRAGLPFLNSILYTFKYMLWIIAVYILVLPIHEAGHLICGLLSGYSFVSFNFLGLTLLKKEGKIKLKRFGLIPSPVLCTMKPPEWAEKAPYRLYTLGGIILNSVCALISLVCCLYVPAFSRAALHLSSFALLNAYLILINIVPNNYSDGLVLKYTVNDPVAVRALWAQLTASALIAEGVNCLDYPEGLCSLPDNADYSNPVIALTDAIHTDPIMASHDFIEAACGISDVLIRSRDGLLPVTRASLVNELLWIEIMNKNRPEVISNLKSSEFLSMRKAMSSRPEIIRCLYAEMLSEGKETEAIKQLQKLDIISMKYPYPQIIDEERYLMDLTRRHFSKNEYNENTQDSDNNSQE